MTYTAGAKLAGACRDLFDVVQSGAVKVEVRRTYPLSEARAPIAIWRPQDDGIFRIYSLT